MSGGGEVAVGDPLRRRVRNALLMPVPLCRKFAPMPAARLSALLRAARAATVLVTATLVTDWCAAPTSAGFVAALAALSVLASAALVAVYRLPVLTAEGPDWGDDLSELLGIPREWLDPARRHRLATAFLPSLVFGVGIATSHAIFEAPVARSLSAAYAGIGTAGMFALLVPVGAYLRVLSPRRR